MKTKSNVMTAQKAARKHEANQAKPNMNLSAKVLLVAGVAIVLAETFLVHAPAYAGMPSNHNQTLSRVR